MLCHVALVTSQKTPFFIVTAMQTSNLIPKKYKSPGSDQILAELIQAAGGNEECRLHGCYDM
jgi:hypothetical protein